MSAYTFVAANVSKTALDVANAEVTLHVSARRPRRVVERARAHRLNSAGEADLGTRARPTRHARGARTLVAVRMQRQVVDYALQRRSLLAEVYAGRVGVAEVCDANPYLLRAAKFHGRGSDAMCPICRKEQLTLVSWVFGDGLGPMSGSARTADELTQLATTREEFSVHVVEVCRTCSWNHLVQSYVLGTAPAPKQRRPRRTERSRRIATE